MARFALVCQVCGADAGDAARCPACGGILMTRYAAPTAADWAAAARHPGLWRHAPLLPVRDAAGAISLGEGNTPLVRSGRIAAALGLDNLWFKVEAANPTGSYKDRIAAVALTRAREAGRRGWIATSSGNAGAALAAYSARSGLPGLLVVPANASLAKLAQIQAYGARLLAVEGFGTSAAHDAAVFAALVSASAARDWALSITAHAFDPWALDGAKTIAFEIAEALDAAPARVYVPAGGGGLAASIARGFREWRELGRAAGQPRLTVVQANGCAPVAASWARGGPLTPADAVTTTISGVQLADPPDGAALLAILRAEDGAARAVPDEEIYAAQARLATEEGLFVEPAAALSLAGLLADHRAGRLAAGDTIVCILTGSGFKDREAMARLAAGRPPLAPIPLDGLQAALAGIE